ncbi:MAG: hypothetical protein J5950_00405 [Clostridia bacterium]|nr:hypothetical protein [Clostridia bacterium]
MKNILTHLKGMKTCLLSYLMALVISWAAFPLIIIVLTGYIDPDISLAVWSLIVTLVYLTVGYQLMHSFGEKDRQPYDHARYALKGLVCSVLAYVIVTALGLLVIYLANEFVIVHHPKFVIETLNGYLRLAVYMPFYWLMRLMEGPKGEICPVPSVTWLRAVLGGLVMLPAGAFGYWMGFTGRRIFKGEIKSPLLRRILYSTPKKRDR